MYFMNREYGNIHMNEADMMAEFIEMYDGDDPMNGISIDEYYSVISENVPVKTVTLDDGLRKIKVRGSDGMMKYEGFIFPDARLKFAEDAPDGGLETAKSGWLPVVECDGADVLPGCIYINPDDIHYRCYPVGGWYASGYGFCSPLVAAGAKLLPASPEYKVSVRTSIGTEKFLMT